MSNITQLVPVLLPNGSTIRLEATVLSSGENGLMREEEVASVASILNFDGVSAAIEGVATTIAGCLDKINPKKASVELGLEVGLDSGKLTALLVKGSSKANLKITLHWEN